MPDYLYVHRSALDLFARLAAQEEANDLLDDPSGIDTRGGWEWRLRERGFALKGHRLVKSKAGHREPSGKHR